MGTGPEGTMELRRGGAAGDEGKILHQRAVSIEQIPQGSEHGPKLMEFKER